MTVRTRFAPSPTGPLHIGGVRTALFNYLYARHTGGAFMLRIEDTDRERSTEQATKGIIDSLDWLRLDRDEPPIFQSLRLPRHAQVAYQLLQAGNAYRCYATPEELAAERELAMKEKRVWRYDGRWRDRDPKDAPPDVKPVIRIKAPRDGDTVLEDMVQGTVRVANTELDDMIILRSDGTPTYNHSVVVDDHDMGITHVIRGDDHLTNTFRQIQVYRAMGWDMPRFAHIPLIHGEDGKKLSKRHGAQFALEFKDNGYLPDALCNYLMRLGWSHGDLEIVNREDAIRLFDIVDVNRGAARMDYQKLLNLNGVYIRAADDDALTQDVMDRLARTDGLTLHPDTPIRIRALMPALKERAKTLVDLAKSATFLAQPQQPDAKAAALLTPEAKTLLGSLHQALAGTDFTIPQIDATLRAFAEANGVKLGQIAQPLRVALTGGTVSPGIDATIAALGKDEALARIATAASM